MDRCHLRYAAEKAQWLQPANPKRRRIQTKNREAGMIYIEHDETLAEGALLIRWSTPRPILQIVVRKLLAAPLYSGTFVLSDHGESVAVPCICVASDDLKSGVGILLTQGDPQLQHMRLAISLGELHGSINARAAAAARRELELALANQTDEWKG